MVYLDCLYDLSLKKQSREKIVRQIILLSLRGLFSYNQTECTCSRFYV